MTPEHKALVAKLNNGEDHLTYQERYEAADAIEALAAEVEEAGSPSTAVQNYKAKLSELRSYAEGCNRRAEAAEAKLKVELEQAREAWDATATHEFNRAEAAEAKLAAAQDALTQLLEECEAVGNPSIGAMENAFRALTKPKATP